MSVSAVGGSLKDQMNITRIIEVVDNRGGAYLAIIDFPDKKRALAAGGLSRKEAVSRLLEDLDNNLDPHNKGA